MKQYPSIVNSVIKDIEVHVFDKLDGSNIRAEWSPKKGFYKFGSRKRLIDDSHVFLGKSISLVKDTHEEKLSRIFKERKFEQITCYFEFFGPRSFAGDHEHGDDHQVTLLDVDVYKHGFIAPADYVKAFSDVVPIPKLLCLGPVTTDLITQVKGGTLSGMTFEGVVCKAPAFKKWALPIMFKIKSEKWLQKVMEKYGHNNLDLLDRL